MWAFRENHHLEGKEGELGNDSLGKVINPIGPSTFILESPGKKKCLPSRLSQNEAPTRNWYKTLKTTRTLVFGDFPVPDNTNSSLMELMKKASVTVTECIMLFNCSLLKKHKHSFSAPCSDWTPGVYKSLMNYWIQLRFLFILKIEIEHKIQNRF